MHPIATDPIRLEPGGARKVLDSRILLARKTDSPYVSKRTYSQRRRVDELQAQPESPLPRLPLLLCRADAAAILGLPLRTFDKHVRPLLNARRIDGPSEHATESALASLPQARAFLGSIGKKAFNAHVRPHLQEIRMCSIRGRI